MIVTPTLRTQPCYPLLLKMSLQCLLLLTPLSDLLLDPQGNKHPLVQNRKLMLAAWKVTENPLRWKEFHAMQPNLYPSQEERVLSQVTNRPGISGLASELGKKLVHFVHLYVKLLVNSVWLSLQYQTINAHRSAISACHNFINGEPTGKHPKMYALLTGIFNERPPQPQYTFIWNADVVLTHIKNV